VSSEYQRISRFYDNVKPKGALKQQQRSVGCEEEEEEEEEKKGT